MVTRSLQLGHDVSKGKLNLAYVLCEFMCTQVEHFAVVVVFGIEEGFLVVDRVVASFVDDEGLVHS